MKNLVSEGLIPSINFHIWEPCNMRCKFCFATFQDVKQSILPKGHLPQEKSIEVVRQLAAFGFTKITFAGGEPTLCPWLPELINIAKECGMTTMMVTNGSKLTKDYLQKLKPNLDWVALSIDSLVEQTNQNSGRAIIGKTAIKEDQYRELILSIKELGFGFKINTVVHRLNFQEDFRPFIEWAKPDRWKVLQVLPISGQNDSEILDFEISEAEFKTFINQHEGLTAIPQVVFEDVDSIRGSYVMVDPGGRFFDNVEGKHRYSLPILEVGCQQAYAQMRYDQNLFERRGGNYRWERQRIPPRITISGKVASGKSTVGKILSEALGYEFVSLGNTIREEASSMGLTISQFQNLCLGKPEMDKNIDQAFSKKYSQMESIVIDYRLGFKFIPDAFHIYLEVPDCLALDRIKKAGRNQDNEKTLAVRNETFQNQFQNAYGIDYTDSKHYDLVLKVTQDCTPEQIVSKILSSF